ncbi:UNVERIFIED_CONTAM: hypothetical protein Sradi_6912500 [Sesamum radiatum]|uniref:Reverse transcriptase domain-containing protein n=1 Tax=Sesamum radiatum TaxID=300843 RepID=A0AAW2JHW1_SESRA
MDRIAERAIFRFDNYLVQLPGFLESVESIWKHRFIGTAMYNVVCKLKNLKAVFRRQQKQTGDLTNNVKKAKCFLDKAQELFDKHKGDLFLDLVKCCRQVYATAVKLEISMLQQRAKLRWLKHGDQSSKLFFRKINSTRVKQRVFQITKASGEVLTEQNDVIQEFILYFQNLLGGSSTHRTIELGFLRHELKHIITTTEASLLIAPVTHLEVKEAFFAIEVESAPGPDGYSSAFYRAAWPVIGQGMFEAVGIFQNGETSETNKYYPASIDTEGRSISDNILLAQELLTGYNQVRLPARCMLKVDIQKAYDSVEWDFLLEVLRLFHFPQQFITLIEQCVSTATFSISLNGAVHGFFKGSLKINPAKSQTILSRSVQQERQRILDYVGFHEGSLPVKYLGIPLSSSRLTLADCRPLIDKVDTRLAGWNNLNLSYAGRLQLIKSVLSSLHTYWASVLIIPKGVLKLLEKDEGNSFGKDQQELEMRKWLGISYANQKRKEDSESEV